MHEQPHEYQVGELVYYDTMRHGAVKCRVEGFEPHAHPYAVTPWLRLKVTARHNRAYPLGFKFTAARTWVRPRKTRPKVVTPPAAFGPGFGGEHEPFVPVMAQDNYRTK